MNRCILFACMFFVACAQSDLQEQSPSISCSALLSYAANLGSKSSTFYSNAITIILPAGPADSVGNITSWFLSWETRDGSTSSIDSFDPMTSTVHLIPFSDPKNSSQTDQAISVQGIVAIQPGTPLTFTWVSRRGGNGTVAPPSDVQFQNIKCGMIQGSDNMSCPDPASCSLSKVYCCLEEGDLATRFSNDWLASWKSTLASPSPDPTSTPQDGRIEKQVGIGLGASLGLITLIVLVIIWLRRARAQRNVLGHMTTSLHVSSPEKITSQRRRSGFRGDSCCDGEAKRPKAMKPTFYNALSAFDQVVRRLSTCYCPYLRSPSDEACQSEIAASRKESSFLPAGPQEAEDSKRSRLRRSHSCPGLYLDLQPQSPPQSTLTGTGRILRKLKSRSSFSIEAPFPFHLRHVGQGHMNNDPLLGLAYPLQPVRILPTSTGLDLSGLSTIQLTLRGTLSLTLAAC